MTACRLLTVVIPLSSLIQDSAHSSFPIGMDLLAYLYEKALGYYVLSAEETYPLLTSLFHGALLPYLHFATHWVFFGQCRDRFGEFSVKPGTMIFPFQGYNLMLNCLSVTYVSCLLVYFDK